ncbi:MAG: 4-hydroxy-tetrahydrodipicolinate synthase [Clostridia bacterium]
MNPIFIGSATAIVTPFDKDGKINFEKFNELIEFQIRNNTDALVVCGTTGEGSTLSVDERLELFKFAVDAANNRVPIIGATGSNSTAFTLELGALAEQTGIDAHLIITPYYNKTSQTGLVKHFHTLADSFTKPIMMYNVPTRTGMNIEPQTYKKLSEHENIVAVKEADSNISKIIKSMVACEDQLDFYIGNDDMISVATSLGFKGVVSVLSNVLPKYTHEMTMHGFIGNCEKCSDMQKQVMDLIEKLFCDVNPVPIKHMMNKLGFDVGGCRLPLYATSENLSFEIEKALNECENLIKQESEVLV